MQLKVFKLKNGKLQYTGIREVREGDAILDGDTSMTETVHLEESDKGKQDLPDDKAALKTSFKRLKPTATDKELDIMVSGKLPIEPHPEWSR